MLLPERHCSRCRKQQEWGCRAKEVLAPDGTVAWQDGAILPIEIDEEPAHRCPRRPILDDPQGWDRLLTFVAAFQKGHLPDAGGVVDQSAKGIAVLRLVDGIVAECREQDEATRRAKAAAQGR